MKIFSPTRHNLWSFLLAGLALTIIVFAACTAAPTPNPGVTPTPTRTPRPSETPTPTPTPLPVWPLGIYVPDNVPALVADAIHTAIVEHPDFFTLATAPATSDVQIIVGDSPDASPIAEWIYTIAAPFSTLAEEVTWLDIQNKWQGINADPADEQPLLMDANTQTVLTTILDDPSTGAIANATTDQLLNTAWATRSTWVILPFEGLGPRWKALSMDGMSVLDKNLDTSAYPLIVYVGATGKEHGIAKLQELIQAPLTNRDPAKMTVLVMTGVTALGRCTATTMDREGVLYPARDIRPWLVDADVTHISNEVSFAGNCQQSCRDSVVFCARPNFIELFKDLDIDVIELTGNHLLDWGQGAMDLSLEMYDEQGFPYYGGGWNVTQAQRPLTITHGVHTFGFIGCNPVGPEFDWATADRSGSAPCDYDLMHAYIRQMREQGIIPIVTLQYWEFDRFEPTPQQMADFRAMVDAGAVIVSGSQAHHPQTFEFYNGVFIHYGLGNLFFDQMQWIEYRREFVDRHIFYDGQHVGTVVLTAMLEDYARPRPMTTEERNAFLTEVFAASGW
jgi:poly-gamma-glutamate synthesis protein (capsule biosynthesis protein)